MLQTAKKIKHYFSKMNIDFRKIPSVQKLLDSKSLDSKKYSRGLIKFFVDIVLDAIRSNKTDLLNLKIREEDLEVEKLGDICMDFMLSELPNNKKVINGTGIILHTGLGRAPLSENAKRSLMVASDYNLVQADKKSGERCLREDFIQKIIKALSGAEDTTVVNNNAAATFLMLKSLTKNKEVIISRGQLVEIGGSYRMPDIMSESGSIMKEVGTTNKTHIKDYEEAITDNTGAILYVHQSNFKISGFTSHPSILELCELGKKHNIPVLADLGSGALVNLEKYGLAHETTVKEIISAGAMACCFSGDKLIGGPQAGIICGNKNLIEAIRKDSYSRMFRVCKLTLRSLEASLLPFLDQTYETEIPIYKFLTTSCDVLRTRAESITRYFSSKNFSIVDTVSYLGGGSVPDEGIPSVAIAVACRNTKEAQILSEKLRFSTPSVFSRVNNQDVFVDLRTINDCDDTTLSAILNSKINEL